MLRHAKHCNIISFSERLSMLNFLEPQFLHIGQFLAFTFIICCLSFNNKIHSSIYYCHSTTRETLTIFELAYYRCGEWAQNLYIIESIIDSGNNEYIESNVSRASNSSTIKHRRVKFTKCIRRSNNEVSKCS